MQIDTIIIGIRQQVLQVIEGLLKLRNIGSKLLQIETFAQNRLDLVYNLRAGSTSDVPMTISSTYMEHVRNPSSS